MFPVCCGENVCFEYVVIKTSLALKVFTTQFSRDKCGSRPLARGIHGSSGCSTGHATAARCTGHVDRPASGETADPSRGAIAWTGMATSHKANTSNTRSRRHTDYLLLPSAH